MDDIVDILVKNSSEIYSGIAICILAIVHAMKKHWTHKLNISGEWQGMSLYIPLQNDNDHECIYKLRVTIKQKGAYIRFEENIYEILDFDNQLMGRPERKVKGKGKFHSDKDIIIRLQESDCLTCGVIYMVSDSWGNELAGYIVVTNPFDGKPVVVRILLRRSKDRAVQISDLKFDDIKFIHEQFLI